MIKWYNDCDIEILSALRYLAVHPRPDGGNQRFNSEHLYQLAYELQRTRHENNLVPPVKEEPFKQPFYDQQKQLFEVRFVNRFTTITKFNGFWNVAGEWVYKDAEVASMWLGWLCALRDQ